MRSILPALLLALQTPAPAASQVEIRILSSMVASEGFGEWGFAALVTVDGKRILFDTGAHPDTVSRNLASLKLDLTGVKTVILSHNHLDHTAGLITLRKQYPEAISTAHVGQGIFLSRTRNGSETNPMPETRKRYETAGGKFLEYAKPTEIAPGVWLTGPVPRPHPEKNYGRGLLLKLPTGETTEDYLPEDMSLAIDTPRGWVVLAGCGHSGIVNTLQYIREKIKNQPIHAAIGGFHLFQLSDEQLDWTASKLKSFGLRNFLGAHCTGIEAVFRIRAGAGLTRATCAVGSVGGGFALEKGIDPGTIAR